jgi:hypothetical protein
VTPKLETGSVVRRAGHGDREGGAPRPCFQFWGQKCQRDEAGRHLPAGAAFVAVPEPVHDAEQSSLGTLLGVLLAVPCALAHAFFLNRLV